MTVPEWAHVWVLHEAVEWAQFDDTENFVAYNAAAGSFHLLTTSARRLLELACDGHARTFEQLVAVFAAESDVSPSADLRTTVRDTIETLDRAGIIRPLLAQ